jgi:hypothetical protein
MIKIHLKLPMNLRLYYLLVSLLKLMLLKINYSMLIGELGRFGDMFLGKFKEEEGGVSE